MHDHKDSFAVIQDPKKGSTAVGGNSFEEEVMHLVKTADKGERKM